MKGPANRGIRLPKQLLDQLDLDVSSSRRYNGAGQRPQSSRKVQRKAARVEKKASRHQQRALNRVHGSSLYQESDETRNRSNTSEGTARAGSAVIESELESLSGADEIDVPSEDGSSENSVPAVTEDWQTRKMRKKLKEDDAQIAALEKKLGLKGKKGTSKSLAEDGLLDLLNGIGEGAESNDSEEQAHLEAREWLVKKRYEALKEDTESEFSGLGESEEEEDTDQDRVSSPIEHEAKHRRASARPESTAVSIQPKNSSREEDHAHQLRRTIRGLINRLSEQNLRSLLTEIEAILVDNPRLKVFTIILDAALDQVGGSDPLSDTFLILYAGFIAALFRTIGYDFGAEAIQRICDPLQRCLETIESDPQSQKRAANLISLLTNLYNLGVVSSIIIYDFVRKFIQTISEINTQLLLKIVKASGQQLRQEDPASLKDIVTHLQSAVNRKHANDISVRTKFMIETITDLKDNKMRTGFNASSITQEHLSRMRKLLSSLGMHNVKASEPLQISLADINDDTKKGRWWQAGAREQKPGYPVELNSKPRDAPRLYADDLVYSEDIQQLAMDQRMNTDVRRSIFVNVMSAADYKDAYHRILGLRLRRSQETEIPKVLLHCATTEQRYNPYYTFVADQLCSTRRMKISFQIALWDTLRKIESEGTEAGEDEGLQLKSVMHLANLYGDLVGNQSIDIKIIKNVAFEVLHGITYAFLEVFFLTISLRTLRGKKGVEEERTLVAIFQPLRQYPDVARAVRSFFETTMRYSDMATKPKDRKKLGQACDIVEKLLREVDSVA